MVDSEGRKQEEDDFTRKEKRKEKEKRKQSHSGGVEEQIQGPPPKRSRENASDVNFEQESPWMNLQLILLLQNKSTDDSRKLEATFKYVRFRADKEEKEGIKTYRVLETVSISRLIVFVNNWIQDLLISSEKDIGNKGYDKQLESSGFCLDYRCWVILKFCFEESRKRNVSLQLKGEMLSVIDCVARGALIQLSFASAFDCERQGFLDAVLNCVSMILTCHGGIQHDSLEFWMTRLEKALELLGEVFKKNLDDNMAGILIIQFSYYLLDAFAKYLTVHPVIKIKFQRFIDRLLEPLMSLLDGLHIRPCKNNPGWTGNLLKLVEEVLSQGIFHPVNIDGFLSLRSSVKYKDTVDGGKLRHNTIRSYHRHLFEKLEKITGQNGLPVCGIGELLHLFVNCVKKQNCISIIGDKGPNGCTLERGNSTGTLTSETRTQLFDFFIQITKHFISRINLYAEEIELNGGTSLSDVLSVLRSANKLLASFKGENLYVRVEDTSEGAFINFLKFVYQTIMSFSAKIKHLMLLSCISENGFKKEVLFLIAKEIITALHHLIDIGYEVIGDDLEGLWVVILTFTACSRSLINVPDQHLLCSGILHLGCSLIDLYSELRQVSNSIFALSKAVRLLASALVENESYCSKTYCSYSNSLTGLICSAKFRLSVSNAIKTIPEGQASACIHLLISDVSESLKWLNVQLHSGHSSNSAELLGRILAELYTLILDSMIVTSGNSVTVGRSLEKLVSLIRYSSTDKELLQTDVMEKFFCVVSGATLSWGASFDEDSVLCWSLVFFFRLYLSSRSLYQEVISLVPPDLSIKMSKVMGVYTAYTGKDWLERTFQNEEGYFFWINKPSANLLSIMQNVSNIYLQENLGTCPPLVYVLNAISIQRLVDLNGRLNSLEYLLARKDKLVDSMPVDDESEISLLQKRSKKWRKRLLNMKQEAAGLTKHMMRWLSTLIKGHPVSASCNNGISKNSSVCELRYEYDAFWDFCIGSLNQNSLPSAIWWIACQHVDIWNGHADKRDLQNFLTCLISSGLSLGSPEINKFILNSNGELSYMENVTIREISLELLNDTGHYEQRFLCRHIVSRVHRILESSLTSSDSGKGYLNSKPDWLEVIHSLEIVSNGISRGKKHEKANEALLMNLSPLRMKQFAPSRSINYALCCDLLNFLAWMPKDVLSSKSSSKLATCILNVERFVVGSLVHRRKILFEGGQDIDVLQLFVTCRRILKSLCASCDGKNEVHPSLMRTFSESPSPLLWLLKSLSAVTGIQTAFSEECTASQVQDMLFTLTNHTSYMLMTIGKYQFQLARWFSGTESKENSYCSSDDDLLKSLTLLNEILREHKKGCSSEKFGAASELLQLKKLSSVLSCIQGFLWGLASTLENTAAGKGKNRFKLSKCNRESLSPLNRFLEECAKSLVDFLQSLFVVGDLDQSSEHCKTTDVSESDTEVDDNTNGVPDESVVKHKSHTGNDGVDSLLITVELFDELCLKKTFLQGLLRGENQELVVLVQRLFLSASAVTRLKLELKDTSLLENLIPILFGISEVFLMEFNKMVSMPPPYSFVLLDGVGKFLEALGYCFSSSSPTLSSKLYVKLIDLHLRSLGKCIVLEGKRATLASKELELNIKDPVDLLSNNPESFVSSGGCYLGSFKATLRTSFKVLVQRSSELLSSAFQVTERAVVGVLDGCLSNYEICLTSSNGGKATSTVAGGIDCLDLLIEFVAGCKRVKDARKHFQGVVPCLLNIILHLQGLGIFFETVNCNGFYTSPDPGSMILACIDILRRVPGKHALFEINASHVGQFLNIPAALFQNILQVQLFEDHLEFDSFDRRYSLELYAGCCQLLCSVVKHCARETQHCCALLQNSVGILLQCLEMLMIKNSAMSRGNNFIWGIQDGVKCACSLRRVYEELHQKKDFMGRYCHQLLASYIMVYCGCGPHKTGIIREVDEALRPGVYALIDACSDDDLQRLHTEFGEGPCRSTLATLQNDYKLNFKYEGKV